MSIWSSLWNADLTSSLSLAKDSGLVARKKVAADSNVAVVSEPATMSTKALDVSSSKDIVCNASVVDDSSDPGI